MSKHCDNSERRELLNKIRELEFAAVDLNLYLDNFPNCQQALSSFNTFTKELIKLKSEYVMKFGVLTNFGYDTSDMPWSWVNEPWPWESRE